MVEQIGAMIEEGPEDWQIVQQMNGVGRMELGGRWKFDSEGKVEVRLVWEDTGVAVTSGLDWQVANTKDDGTWGAVLENIPAGGLYRLETRLRVAEIPAGEWSPRGDMRHFLGVGDLWVIAGQSNSAGYGRGPYEDPAELGVHLFRNSERWALATHPMNESTDTQHAVNREAANPGHSPYLQFGRLLKRDLGYPVGLVQTSLGGSPLRRWNPGEPEDSDLFENMVRCVEKVGGKVRGILWYQGESDAGTDADATSYAERFAQAVGAWREALKDTKLPVLTVQLNRVFRPEDDAEADRYWSQVREAQRQVPKQVPVVAVVPTLDLPLSDLIHISPAGNMLLGERLARAALGMVYGRGIAWKAPDLVAVRSKDGRVELEFVNVESRMDSIDVQANAFRIEDEGGQVPVTEVIYPQDNRVELVLGRALQGKATVHGAYGMAPATAPADMERFLPMLGFAGVDIACDC
ncbi:MAG: hypothetical protein OSB73_23545 [Candidatus Latescibacteria bacterium]|nr:hypothetical protein [Candidatus Latescibacterota bacterium]